jgi:hypothetical protein
MCDVWFRVGSRKAQAELKSGAYVSNLQKAIRELMSPRFKDIPIPDILVRVSEEADPLDPTVELQTLVDNIGIGKRDNPFVVDDAPQQGNFHIFYAPSFLC